MTADMSVAPEIARLAETVALVPAQPTPGPHRAENAPQEAAATPTLGTLARQLRMLAGAPERWWRLVRFNPDRSVRIIVDECSSYRAWLAVLPPGHTGQDCDCDAATIIAGEVTDGSRASAILRPGPTRVHGQRHWLRGHGAGYSISLHIRAVRQNTSAREMPDTLAARASGEDLREEAADGGERASAG